MPAQVQATGPPTYREGVQVSLLKVSDTRHRVAVVRPDGSGETVELASKDFLLHDLAHFAFEVEAGLTHGVWGSVAYGGSLDGTGLDGADYDLAAANQRRVGCPRTPPRSATAGPLAGHALRAGDDNRVAVHLIHAVRGPGRVRTASLGHVAGAEIAGRRVGESEIVGPSANTLVAIGVGES